MKWYKCESPNSILQLPFLRGIWLNCNCQTVFLTILLFPFWKIDIVILCGNRTMRKTVKAVHFEAGADKLDEVDHGSEQAIRPRLGRAAEKNEAQTEE